jgi:hypothetical protein
LNYITTIASRRKTSNLPIPLFRFLRCITSVVFWVVRISHSGSSNILINTFSVSDINLHFEHVIGCHCINVSKIVHVLQRVLYLLTNFMPYCIKCIDFLLIHDAVYFIYILMYSLGHTPNDWYIRIICECQSRTIDCLWETNCLLFFFVNPPGSYPWLIHDFTGSRISYINYFIGNQIFAFTSFSFLIPVIVVGDVACGVKFHIAFFYVKARTKVLQAARFH